MCSFLAKSLFRTKFRLATATALALTILQFFGAFSHLFEKDYYTEFSYPYEGDVRSSVSQLRLDKKPDVAPVNFYNYTFRKDCRSRCDSETTGLRLVFVIKSAPEHFERRLAIRETWGYEGRFSDVEIRRVFVLGFQSDVRQQERIDKESMVYEDIVQADFVDAYFNNTIKTMMGMRWAVKFCPNAKFYMFVDDDYYVSLKNALRFARNPTNYPGYLLEPLFALKRSGDFELPEHARLYAGYVFFSSPHRHYTGTWSVSLNEYPFHMWPPYVTAGAYVLSREALLEMYYTSFYTKHFRFDDIYLGLIAKKAEIEPFHCEEFYFHRKPYVAPDYKFVVASHGYSDHEEMQRVWTEQKSLGNA